MRGQKLPDMEKKDEKNFREKKSNQVAKWNKKMGGRSFVITCGAFEDTQRYSQSRLGGRQPPGPSSRPSIINIPLEVGARGYVNPRKSAVLASLSFMCKIRDFKKFAKSLSKVFMLGTIF